MDFNITTSSLSLYVDDLEQTHAVGSNSAQGDREEGDDGMWERIIIQKNIIKEWSILSKKYLESSTFLFIILVHTCV